MVILLGIDTPIGLALVRELGARGVAVHGIARDRRGVGLYSRHLASGLIHPRRDESLIARIRHLADTHQATHLMAISESDIAFLNRHREALQGLRCLFPDAQHMARVLDKAALHEDARRLGIPVPTQWQPTDMASIEALCQQTSYPVVLKWADPNRVAGRLASLGLPLEKARYCHRADELRGALMRYREVGELPLVQAWCPGHGLAQMVLMHRGEPVLSFQHRRLHEWPPEGGTSTVCESLPSDAHPELLAGSIALLRAIDWTGPAMVEYRHDPVTGQSTLMEVNGRYWGSYPLARIAGAHFAWTHLRLDQGLMPDLPGPPDAGWQCRFLIPDTRRLWRICAEPERIQDRSLRFHCPREVGQYLSYAFRRRRRHFLFSWQDPLPAVVDSAGALLEAVRRFKPSSFKA